MGRPAIVLGAVVLTSCSAGASSVEVACAPSPYERETPLVIAHAGGDTLAPANTMLALSIGIEEGADALDLDLRMTSDGVIVARHDRDLSTTTDGTGPVDEATWNEVSTLDATAGWTGEPIASRVGVARLDRALVAFPDTMFSLELKQTTPSLAEPLCELLREGDDLERVFVSANDDDAAYAFADACPDGLITTTYRDLDDREAAEEAQEPWCAASPIGQPPYRSDLVDRFGELIENSHRHGSAVFTWTVDDPNDLRRLAELGVDGVYTDRPDIARRVFDEVATE